ncbi:MAG: PstS family phosphate ABC transporter substrate-binding protein [Bdellovibrionota bacterium]|nr:PstS family phosphate ABC transporter substrate-binding protein [Bdellovibrionota bacterium]
MIIKNFVILLCLLSFNAFSSPSSLRGKILIDGSSTVYPITEAVAEEFRNDYPRIRVNIGVSGTGGGFKKFSVGEIDINNASRRIKGKEALKASKNNINYMEVPVAFDGITVVINKANTWANKMTVQQLKKLWDRGSKVKTWKDLNPAWPDRKIKLYGPGTDSGTFDYFTKAINGKSGRCRSNFIKSEDDNVLVKGVSGDIDALGFFGFAYYKENKKELQAVSIATKNNNYVMPSEKTINNSTYKPLSRPVFIYVNTETYKKDEVQAFIDFYINKAKDLVSEVGYIPLPTKLYKNSLAKLTKFKM